MRERVPLTDRRRRGTPREDRYVLVGLRSDFICEPLERDARDYPAVANCDVEYAGDMLAPHTSIGLLVEDDQ